MSLDPHKRMLFTDGEGLFYEDLNEVGDGMLSAAWEWPGYGDALPHAVVAAATFETVFSTAVDLSLMVFSKGGGPSLAASGLSLVVGAGFLGLYAGAGEPAILDPQLRWGKVGGGQESIVLAAAPSGQKRYDVVTLTINQSDGDPDPDGRDFKDATTGALTSTHPNKRRSLSPVLTVTQGTPGVSPTPPVTSLNTVALVLVNDTAIETVYDCTFPFGPAFTSISVPARDALRATGEWPASAAGNGHIGATAGSEVAVIMPPQFAGDPTARLLGVEIDYTLTTGSTVHLAKGIGVSATALTEITALLTMGGTNVTRVDLRGYPKYSVTDRFQTYWGHGGFAKQGQLTAGSALNSISLRVRAGNPGDTIRGVRWFWAKG